MRNDELTPAIGPPSPRGGSRAGEPPSCSPAWRKIFQQVGGRDKLMECTREWQRRREAGEEPPRTPEQEAQTRRSMAILASASRRVRARQQPAVISSRFGGHRRERRSRPCRRVARRGGRRVGSPSAASSDDGPPGEPDPAGRAKARHLAARIHGWACDLPGREPDRGCYALRRVAA